MALYNELLPFNGTVHIEQLADQAFEYLGQHLVISEEERIAIVLWIISSYTYDSFSIYPRLAAISPERRCGKSTLLTSVEALLKYPVMASNMSAATIVRVKALCAELVLIIDEADTFIRNAEGEIQGILNSGHNKASAKVLRCSGDDFSPHVFSTWYPVILASIGGLKDTLMDRSIVVNLRRKSSKEHVTRLPLNVRDNWLGWRQKVLKWIQDESLTFEQSPIVPPDRGNDRAVDNWVPLFTIADKISDEWLSKCERAYKELTTAVEPEQPTRLLADIRLILEKTADDKISSRDLIDTLRKDDSAEWGEHKLSQVKMANMLEPYGIKPRDIRFGAKVLRGYIKSQFTDAFDRYLPPI